MTHPLAGQWQFEVGGMMTANLSQDRTATRQYVSGAQLVGNAIQEVRGFFPLTAIINLEISNKLELSGLLFNNRSGAASAPVPVTGLIRLPEVIDPITSGSMNLYVGGATLQLYSLNLVSADLIHLIMLRNTIIQGNFPFWMVLGGGRMRRVKLTQPNLT